MKLITTVSSVACAFAILGAGIAAADPSDEVDLQVIPPSVPGGAPQIQATIDSSWVRASALSIRAENGGLIRASDVRTYAQGDEPAAIAIVINGQEIWIGNDEIESDDDARYYGILSGIERAIDSLHLADAMPAGSEGMVVTYSTGASARVPMGPVGRLTGASFGAQRDYYRLIGTDLVQGVALAVASLERSHATRKLLIVIGDGNDTNNEAAKVELRELHQRAARDRIQTAAVIYKGAVSDPGNVITTMVPAARTVNSSDGVAAELTSIVDRFTNRYYARFPGVLDGVTLPWDGGTHDLTVRAASAEYDSVGLTLPRWQSARSWHLSWSWLTQLAAGSVLAALYLLAIALRSRWQAASTRS